MIPSSVNGSNPEDVRYADAVDCDRWRYFWPAPVSQVSAAAKLYLSIASENGVSEVARRSGSNGTVCRRYSKPLSGWLASM